MNKTFGLILATSAFTLALTVFIWYRVGHFKEGDTQGFSYLLFILPMILCSVLAVIFTIFAFIAHFQHRDFLTGAIVCGCLLGLSLVLSIAALMSAGEPFFQWSHEKPLSSVKVVPVEYKGLRISVIESQPGWIQATQISSGVAVWERRVYDSPDGSDIYITSWIVEGDELKIENNAGQTFVFDLANGTVVAQPAR